MHSDLSPHLHTQECNDIIRALRKCRADHPIAKFVGYCNDIDFSMTKCLRKEKDEQRTANRRKAEERLERIVKSKEAERALRRSQESQNP